MLLHRRLGSIVWLTNHIGMVSNLVMVTRKVNDMTPAQLTTALRRLRRDMREAAAAPAVADMTPRELSAALARMLRRLKANR